MVHLRKLFNPLLPTLRNIISSIISSISISISSREGEEANMVGQEEEMDLDMIVQR